MRTIAHISDLHFGRVDHAILPALARAVTAAEPDLVVVSGDLTQRARQREFAEARRFLDTLPFPRIIVPGNHDVPLYDVVSRWRAPLAKYRQYINNDLAPFYADDEIAVLGINTSRSLTFKGGRINRAQVAASCTRMEARPADTTRILVTHHPFDVAEGGSGRVRRAGMAMAAFARCRIDMILTGHLHISRTGSSTARYRIAGYSALMIQAGTATSSRQRGERNAWNVIRIERPQAVVECRTWDPGQASFALSRTDRFQLSSDGWRPSSIAGTTGEA